MPGFSTKFLPHPALNLIKRSRPVYAIGRRVRFGLGTLMGARAVPGLSGRVHYNDFMLNSDSASDIAAYLGGARQFVEILDLALRDSRGQGLGEGTGPILEIGCGYGRIVRELRRQFPQVRLYVSDVIEEGARFAASEFGATWMPPIESAGADWANRFGLIYLLSVYTHLRRDLIEANLRRVVDALAPGGVVVFTIHGEGSARTAERYDQYWLDKAKLLESFARDGYYYERYPYYFGDYGLTWLSEQSVLALVERIAPEMQLVSYRPLALDEHQDVFVYRKGSHPGFPTQ